MEEQIQFYHTCDVADVRHEVGSKVNRSTLPEKWLAGAIPLGFVVVIPATAPIQVDPNAKQVSQGGPKIAPVPPGDPKASPSAADNNAAK